MKEGCARVVVGDVCGVRRRNRRVEVGGGVVADEHGGSRVVEDARIAVGDVAKKMVYVGRIDVGKLGTRRLGIVWGWDGVKEG